MDKIPKYIKSSRYSCSGHAFIGECLGAEAFTVPHIEHFFYYKCLGYHLSDITYRTKRIGIVNCNTKNK